MSSELDELRVIQQWTGAFGGPAYMRRAKAVEAVWEHLLERCRQKREEWLAIPKLRLGVLMAVASEADTLRKFLVDPRHADELRRLHDEWRPELRIAVSPATSPRQIENALRQLARSFERFNARWSRFLNDIDLSEVNRLRDGYNRYYVMEKECAVRSASVARAGFRPLPFATTDDLRREFPELPMLALRE